MKERSNHLKRVQKQVLRSAKQNDSNIETKRSPNQLKLNVPQNKAPSDKEIFDEFVPANQQVPRVGLRHSYH